MNTVIANIDNPKPRKPWSYWQPSLQLRLWFVALPWAQIEAGVINPAPVQRQRGEPLCRVGLADQPVELAGSVGPQELRLDGVELRLQLGDAGVHPLRVGFRRCRSRSQQP
ncbi:hypothetical protein [Mycobacterium sp.]|uniref:hypothetical protein n=1 Tax=Mycobacterium sp. TaxID=1785 RepID=UPI003F986CEC